MVAEAGLVQRSISVPQSVINGVNATLVAGLQQLLSLSSQQGASWYDISYSISWGRRPEQIIIAHGILKPEDDSVFMETLMHSLSTYSIEGVKTWVAPVTTLGFPYQISTQVGAILQVRMGFMTSGLATFVLS